MESLRGDWHGVAGGNTNIGKVRAKLDQQGSALTGHIAFLDLAVVPVEAEVRGSIQEGRLIDAAVQMITPTQVAPPGSITPSSGRMLGIVEEDGRKISGFWMTNIGTSGGFVLVKANSR